MLIKLTSHEETFKTEGIATFLLFSEFSLSKSELIFFLFFLLLMAQMKKWMKNYVI